MKHPSLGEKAAALVVVLSLSLFLVLIVVSLTVSMRLERQAAHYWVERSRADLMAGEAVEIAKAQLADVLDSGDDYAISMPGRIVVKGSGGGWDVVALSSGSAVTSGTDLLSPADLNRVVKTGDGLPAIDPKGTAMNLPWVYVYQNGDRVADANPSISNTNPIIGRYAYWVDDESSRINVNTAWKRTGNTNTQAHPSQIELMGISSDIATTDADTVFEKSKESPLESAPAAGLLAPALGPVLSTNRFAVTAYNPTPNLNPFGEPKIYLTTQASRIPPAIASQPNASDYFLDILTTADKDPGRVSALDASKVGAVVKKLHGYLTRTDWPYTPGKNFAQKFKPTDESRIIQLALDIIDYVRARESGYAVVDSLRGTWNGTDFTMSEASAAGAFISTGRHPMFTEVAVLVSDTASNGYFTLQVKAEVFLPDSYGINSYDLKGSRLYIHTGKTNLVGSGPAIGASGGPVASGTLVKGGYVTLTTPPIDYTVSRPTAPVQLRVSLLGPNSGADQFRVYDVAPLVVDVANIPCPVNPVGSTEWTSAEVSDPRVNKSRSNWVVRSSGNTFGAANSIWLQQNAATTPLTDGTGAAASLFMPPQKGSPGNLNGLVSSVAELGYITTGAESDSAGVPWRTLRLRPTSSGDTELPDWALLDLFIAPLDLSAAQRALYEPGTNGRNGKININAAVQPFSETTGKLQPLQALTQATGLPGGMVTNLLEHRLATNARTDLSTSFYQSPGQLAEIAGIADAGEASEQNIRQIYDLTTTRGSVFRVFAVGESIQQSVSGTLRVNSSKRVESVVAPSGAKGEGYRSISWREIPF